MCKGVDMEGLTCINHQPECAERRHESGFAAVRPQAPLQLRRFLNLRGFPSAKLWTALAAAVFLTAAVLPVWTVRADPVSGRICGEDECVIISVSGQVQNVYDAGGRFLFDLHTYYEPFFPFLAKTDTVFGIQVDDRYEFYSAKAGGRFLTMPAEDSQTDRRGSFFTVTSLSKGISVLYDCEGHELGRTDRPVVLSGDIRKTRTHLLRLENGFVFGVQSGEDACWMRADPAAGTCTRIQNGTLTGLLESNMDCYPMGDLLVFQPYYSAAENEQGNEGGLVVSLDGEILMDHVKEVSRHYWEGDRFGWMDEIPCDYVLRTEDGEPGAVLYNKVLMPVCTFTDPDEPVVYAGEYVKGCAYPELNDSLCDGFASDADTGSCPYFIVDGWYNVLIDGRPEVFPIRPDETLQEFNAGFYKTESKEEKRTIYRVYDRHSYELLAEDDSNDMELYLGRDGLVVLNRREDAATGFPKSIFTAYDLNGTEVYSTDSAWLYPFRGYWFTRRGVHKGITNIYGNWLMRTEGWTE